MQLNLLQVQPRESSYLPRPGARDLVSLLAVFVMAAGLSFWLSSVWPHVLADRAAEASNVWFQADVVRVFENATQRWSDHYRTKVHPLFSIAINPLAVVLIKFGVQPWAAMRMLLGLAAGLLVSLTYVVGRLVGLRCIDAWLTSGMLVASSSFVFWAGVPETFLFGSVSMAVVLTISALALHVHLGPRWYVLATVVSMSMTITNVSLAIVAALARFRWRRAARVLADGLLITIVIWVVQKYLYPTAGFFFGDQEEVRYTLMAESAGPLQRVATMLWASFLIQGIEFLPNPETSLWPFLSVEHAGLSSATPWQMSALALWSVVLAVGAVAIVRNKRLGRFRWVLGAGLAFQVVLHIFYGDETFLYSAHWMPLLALQAGASLLLFPVWWWRVGLFGLLVAAAANNLTAFQDVSHRIAVAAPERAQVLSEQARRPADPWPRGGGHALLASTGMPLENRGWLEAGGAFSPSLKSFGVVIWVFDVATGRRLATSDDVELLSTKHAWIDLPAGQVAIQADTPYYRLRWATSDGGGYKLTLENTAPATRRLEIVTRSVGPAGGPLKKIAWDGHIMQVGDGWHIQPPEGAAVMLTDEKRSDWMLADRFTQFERAVIESKSGWAAARIRITSPKVIVLLHPVAASLTSSRQRNRQAGQFSVDGIPDSLDGLLRANTHHLLAGLVDEQTRPGDPVNYPLQWMRDGAYVVVALARAGEVDIARSLARGLAVEDFFGGFGAEADSPGLALWAIAEACAAAASTECASEMWLHVVRKVGIIDRMIHTNAPMHAEFSGPLVPLLPKSVDPTLVAIPSINGLVNGRMDNDFRPFYVTASVVGGLMSASKLAASLGRHAEALAWRDTAEDLKTTYRVAMRQRQAMSHAAPFKDIRTFINAIYPFETAEKPVLRRALDSKLAMGIHVNHQNMWTYFGLAIGHQWLRLERPDRALETLQYYARRDRVPGLWVFWEGDSEENSFGIWSTIRGNVIPKGVTPHYWSSAEAQLLALAMLGYVDTESQSLVIGAGLQSSDLQRPIAVHGLGTGFGSVCWLWDGQRRLTVGGASSGLRIQLGSGFPKNSELVLTIGCDRVPSSAVD